MNAMIELAEKYVFHIPLYKHVADELLLIEIDDLLDELISDLSENGFENFYLTKAKAHYRSRCFDEVLITIFSSSDSPAEIFEKWFRDNNDALCQEAFSYECGNSMIIHELM